MARTHVPDQNAFWNDETANVTGVRLKTTVPEITPVECKFDYLTGGHETLVFLALTIAKNHSKEVTLRAMASAIGILFKQKRDMLGSGGKAVSLSDLDGEVPVEDMEAEQVVGAAWDTGSTITAGEIAAYLGDMDELGSYFGVLCLAGVKKRTDKNRDAFYKNRVSNVKATVNEELVIFTEGSQFLSDAVLDTVYASFNSFQANRMFFVRETVQLSAGIYVGPALSFQNMFLLLEDAGLGSLRVIKEAVLKYTFIRRDFPELKSELHAANAAQKAIRRITEAERPYCKAIYGNKFVPVAQNDIANLLGVCKMAMSYTVETYRNFDGGNVSEKQEELIRTRLEAAGDYVPGDLDLTE